LVEESLRWQFEDSVSAFEVSLSSSKDLRAA